MRNNLVGIVLTIVEKWFYNSNLHGHLSLLGVKAAGISDLLKYRYTSIPNIDFEI